MTLDGNKKDLPILKIDEAGLSHLPVCKEPSKKFEKIYSVGFSMRTSRKEDRKKMLGYEDANYNLRVSTGNGIVDPSKSSRRYVKPEYVDYLLSFGL